MNYFIFIINWFIVMIITYLLYINNHLDWYSFIGGIITSIILFLLTTKLNKY